MWKKSFTYLNRHSKLSRWYWLTTVLIVLSTLLHTLGLFISISWLTVEEKINSKVHIDFQSNQICVKEIEGRICYPSYLPVDQCNATDVRQWINYCLVKRGMSFNRTLMNNCHCSIVRSTSLLNRNSSLIVLLLIFISFITMSKLCSSEECLLDYLHKYLLIILLISTIIVEIHGLYSIYLDQMDLSQRLQSYLFVVKIYFSWFVSFQLLMICNQLLIILILLSCN